MFTLKKVMQANSLSCLIFGVLFLCIPIEIVNFLSAEKPMPVWVLVAIALVLIINGLALLWEASKPEIDTLSVVFFSVGDLVWVVISCLLVVLQIWITSANGILATVLVAIMVAFFGVSQLVMLTKKITA